MRILHIAFKNINSLSGEHEIDFTKDPFVYSSLYAIVGTTGSGKSSILDAISLAIYGVTPRMGKISSKDVSTAGAILTRGQKEAYTKVTYACKAGVFRSEWHISTARTGNLRDYEMMLFDIESDQALDYNKSAIPKANEEKIGLSYEQFNKSVMLAQGEFAEFLKAPKKDRGDLLEKITGSDIYRRIGAEVFQRHKEQELKTKDLNLILTSKKEVQRPNEEIEIQKAEENKLQKQLVDLEKQVENLREQNRRIEEILIKEKQLEQTKNKLLNSKKDLDLFMQEEGKAWQAHKKILPQLSDLQTWEQLEGNLKKLDSQNTALQQEKNSLETESNQIIAKISEIVQETTSTDTAIDQLEVFNNKYEGIDYKRSELGAEFREKDATAKVLVHNLGSSVSFNTTSQDFAKQLKSKQEEVQNQYQLLLNQAKIKDASLTQEKVESQEAQLAALRRAQLLANELQSLFKRSEETQQEVLNLEKSLAELNQERESLKAQVEVLQLKHEKLELERQNALLKQSLEAHRANLKPGEACPLCGALEHPFAIHSPNLASEMQTALKELKSQVDIAKERYQKNINDKTNLENQITKDKQLILDTHTKITSYRKSFNTEFKDLTNSPETFDFVNAIQLKENLYKNLQNALDIKMKLSAYAELLPIAEQMAILLEQGKALKEQLEALYKGTDFKQVYQNLREAFQKNLISWNHKIEQEKLLVKEIDLLQENFKTASFKLEEELRQKGIESISLALSLRLTDSVYTTYENKLQTIQSALQKATTEQELQSKELLGLKEGVQLENKEKIQENLTENLEELAQLREAEKQVAIFLSTQLSLQTDILALETQIQALTKDAKPLILLQKMIGDAKGTRFNDYAQDMTLTYLLQLANKRLDGLNKRYKVDKPAETEGDSLMVIDTDMGNQRRAINTLSGGETFMVSLALALALSDLAAKNVQIESMFIDEGFGTLDPEALDQTLDALERLQIESSKLIGIISHVDSLKERISTQIQLTQDGKGYSKMNIVG